MRKIILILILFVFPLHADPFSDWTKKVKEIRLANGMKFLLYERGEAPVFSAFIRFRAGGIEEEEGKTGLAHFLEHMAFKGTSTIGTTDYSKERPILSEIQKVGEELANEYRNAADQKRIIILRERLRELHRQEEKYLVKEEFSKRMMENGGHDLNATTSKDMTSYFVSLPTEKLRFWAELESERIFKPVFREFYEEKDVVLEERRMRVDNDPDGRLYEAFLEAAFEEGPYHLPTIGTEKDLLLLTVSDLESFWRRHYHPANAVGVIVGKFSSKEAEKILNETFGKINLRGKKGEQEGRGYEGQKKERRLSIAFPARPRLLIGYHKPTLPSRDDYLFDLLNEILGEGRTSRLYKKLVLERKVVSNVETSSGVPGARLSNLFMIGLSPLENHSPEEVLKVMDEEIEGIKRDGVTVEEVEKAKNQLTVGLLWKLKTNRGLASELSYFEIVAGNWRYLADYLKEVGRFQPNDIQDLARRYLNHSNRTVGILKSSS